MIRVVLAVALAIALVALSVPAIDHGSAVKSERQVERELATLDRAATSLVRDEELPAAGHAGARRTVTLSLPADSFASRSIAFLEIERVRDGSVATYALEGRSDRVVHLDAPIVSPTADPDRETIELRGPGTRAFVLTLERGDSGDPIVVLERA